MQDNTIYFYEYDEPALEAGKYTIVVEQKIYSQQKEDTQDKERKDGRIPSTTFTKKADFAIYTEQFALNPQEIESVFPPANSLGDYANCFPHILIHRSTLPWERRVCDNEKYKKVPWLGLLLFDQAETPLIETVSLKKLCEAKQNNIKFPPSTLEYIKKEKELININDLVNIIDVEASLLKQIIPDTTEELELMAHVRHSDNKKFAVILGNRLPQKSGSSTVHLVSLENYYNEDGFFHYKDAEDSDKIRLVSLKSWSFTSFSEKITLEDILKKLNHTPSNLRLPDQSNIHAQTYVKQGYVPLRHHLRGGKKTISWYCSPLNPGFDPEQYDKLPVASADELVRYNPENGLFEVTYSAAWQLGRLMTLENKGVAMDLFQWKRSQNQTFEADKQKILHLPLQENATDVEGIPSNVQNWFRDLSLLKHIPFKYLVPDQTMLPLESIRFFQVNQLWVDCLLDGAFSIGRITKSDQNHDAQQRDQLRSNNSYKLGEYKKGTLDYLSGFLLRSEVVSEYPHLMVKGYESIPYESITKGQGDINKQKLISQEFELSSDSAKEINLVRMERLSKNVLLCLFAGKIATLDIYQAQEKNHFGLTRENREFYKNIQENGKKIKINDKSWQQEEKRVINIKGLAEEMKNDEQTINSSLFAFQMIEGVKKVRWVVSIAKN